MERSSEMSEKAESLTQGIDLEAKNLSLKGLIHDFYFQ